MGSEFQKSKSGFKISILEILCVPIFRHKRQLWIFGPNFWGRIFKIQVWIQNQHPWDTRDTSFQTKRTILNFWAQICPKMNFGVGISKIYGQLLIFWPKFGKLPNYVQYFGSNIVEGVAESWVEVEMSWVEVDGAGWSWVEVVARFSNTHFKYH